MSHKRLLIFCPLYPPHVGGLESHAEQFNEHMSDVGYKITVFTPKVVPGSADFENKGGIDIFRFPAWQIIPNYPVPKFWKTSFWMQWLKIWKEPSDIVISRTRFFLTSLLALIYSKVKRKPWLHIEHGSDFVHLTNPLTSFLARLFDLTLGRIIFLSANKLVANSNASASFVKMLAPERDVDVIYRGVDQQLIEKIQPHGANDMGFKVVYCGRLIDGKGVPDLIRAIAEVNDKSILCTIIGDGPQKKLLEALAKKLRLSKNIRFLGEKSWTNAIGYVKGADLVVNPSYTEGLPTSVIEAALCKKAIIATNVGGTTEIIEHNVSGVLFSPGDIGSLSKHILTFLNSHKLRQAMAIASFDKVSNKFDWQKTTQLYVDAIDNL